MARRVAVEAPQYTVEREWPESTIVCLGTGPSLTAADLERVAAARIAALTDDRQSGQVRVIAVNDAVRLAPWADVLYACDAQWWTWHKGVPAFPGRKFSIDARVARLWPEIAILRDTGVTGLELGRHAIRTGGNGGYQAINLAVHLGARRIVLLGYDMQATGRRDHFFGSHPNRVRPTFTIYLQHFKTIAAPLAAAGVEVINCTRTTALDMFPCQPLEEVL